MSNYFAYIVILDFDVSNDSKNGESNEIIEMSWVIFDTENRCVSEQTSLYVRPEYTSIPETKLRSLGVDESAFKSASPLGAVVQAFDGQVFSKYQDSRKPIAIMCFGSSRFQCFKADSKRKDVTLFAHFDKIVDLQQLILSKYSNEAVTEDDVRTLEKAAQKFLVVDNVSSCSTGLDRCLTISTLLTVLLSDRLEIDKSALISVSETDEDSNASGILNGKLLGGGGGTLANSSSAVCSSTGSSGSTASSNRPPNCATFGTTPSPIVRLRGLPWDIKEATLVDFFKAVCRVNPNNVHVVIGLDGRTNGEAYVVVNSIEERDLAIQELHGKFVGRRWVEVFKATQDELNRYLASRKTLTGGCPAVGEVLRSVLRLRGLPWSCNEYEIVKFFKEGGFSLSVDEVIMGYGMDNRLNGEAWVCLESPEKADEARRVLNKRLMGRRYIEIFPATQQEVENARNYNTALPSYHPIRNNARVLPPKRDVHIRTYNHMPTMYPPPKRDIHRYSQGGAGPPEFTVLRMRGLPYHANEQHIVNFFQGYLMTAILPSTPSIHGRPSGEAYVEFVSPHEAHRALQNKQGATMDRRYIELFPGTKEEMECAANGEDPRAAGLPPYRERVCRPY